MVDTRRTIDGRTVLVLVRWAQVIVDDADNYYSLSPAESKTLQQAIDNAVEAMEQVQFAPQDTDESELPANAEPVAAEPPL